MENNPKVGSKELMIKIEGDIRGSDAFKTYLKKLLESIDDITSAENKHVFSAKEYLGGAVKVSVSYTKEKI